MPTKKEPKLISEADMLKEIQKPKKEKTKKRKPPKSKASGLTGNIGRLGRKYGERSAEYHNKMLNDMKNRHPSDYKQLVKDGKSKKAMSVVEKADRAAVLKAHEALGIDLPAIEKELAQGGNK